MVKALQYLQADISSVVDHDDEAEATAFRSLLTHLMSRPPTPRVTKSQNLLDEDSRMEDAASTNGNNDLELKNGPSQEAPPGSEGASSMERDRQRQAVFDALLAFIDPHDQEPTVDLMDLVRV